MGVELRGDAFEVMAFSPAEQLVAPLHAGSSTSHRTAQVTNRWPFASTYVSIPQK